jgi:hypothetical protein
MLSWSHQPISKRYTSFQKSDITFDPPCPVRVEEGSRARMGEVTEEIPDDRGLSLSLGNGIDEVVKSYDRAHQIHQ